LGFNLSGMCSSLEILLHLTLIRRLHCEASSLGGFGTGRCGILFGMGTRRVLSRKECKYWLSLERKGEGGGGGRNLASTSRVSSSGGAVERGSGWTGCGAPPTPRPCSHPAPPATPVPPLPPSQPRRGDVGDSLRFAGSELAPQRLHLCSSLVREYRQCCPRRHITYSGRAS
jgi:hypothetical protein